MRSPVTCAFCQALASGHVTAYDDRHRVVVPRLATCDNEACWEAAYQRVRRYPERTWKYDPQPQGLF